MRIETWEIMQNADLDARREQGSCLSHVLVAGTLWKRQGAQPFVWREAGRPSRPGSIPSLHGMGSDSCPQDFWREDLAPSPRCCGTRGPRPPRA